MCILYFYIVGVIIAFIMAMILLIKEEKKTKKDKTLQHGMVAPIAILSWISVYLMFFKLKDKFKA